MDSNLDFLNEEFDPTTMPELEGTYNPDDFKQTKEIEDTVVEDDDPKDDGATVDDWDEFVAKGGSTNGEMSEEEKAQLELINKTTGKDFKSIEEFKATLEGKKEEKVEKEEVEEPKEKPFEERVAEIETQKKNVKALLDLDGEELLRMDIKRLDKDANEDDIDLEIEALRNSGMLRSKIRELKGAISSQIDILNGKIETIKTEEEKKTEARRANNRNKLKETLQNSKKLFDAIDIPEEVSKNAYKSVVDGSFHEMLKDHKTVAKLATLLQMEESIIDAFKSAKQGGLAFENGKLAILKNAANVKPRTQSGSSDIASLFTNASPEATLEMIANDGIEYVDNKK